MPHPAPLPVCACLALLRRTPEGVVLLTVTRRHDPARCMPGGKSDPGETPLQTVVRETEEETGLRVPAPALEPVYRGVCPTQASPDHDVVAFWAWWQPAWGEPCTREAGIEPAWLPLDAFEKRCAFPDFNARLWVALKQAVPTAFPMG